MPNPIVHKSHVFKPQINDAKAIKIFADANDV